MAHNNYTLRVTAGTSYDPSTHQTVTVNHPAPISIQSEHTDVSLNIRIQVRTRTLLSMSTLNLP